jgi:hypothetical protein
MRALPSGAWALLLAGLLPSCSTSTGATPVGAEPRAAADTTEVRPDETPGDETVSIDSSQTGSIGMAECLKDEDCTLDEEGVGLAWGRAELLGSSCNHEVHNDGRPTCECRISMIFSAGDAGVSAEPREISLYPGNRPDDCSEYSRGAGCLYCERDFPGCDIADPQSCDAVCADISARFDQEAHRTYAVEARLTRCDPESYHCQRVTQVDGACYAGRLGALQARLDCSASDETLIEHLGDPAEPPCAPRAEVACAASEDCPRGLACKSGSCASCEQTCISAGNDSEFVCQGGGECTADEVCAAGTCVPAGNAECKWFGDCPENQSCLVSGTSGNGRGNADTRSFCGTVR